MRLYIIVFFGLLQQIVFGQKEPENIKLVELNSVLVRGDSMSRDTNLVFRKHYDKYGILIRKDITDKFGYGTICSIDYIYSNCQLSDSTGDCFSPKSSTQEINSIDTIFFTENLSWKETNGTRFLQRRDLIYGNGDFRVTHFVYDSEGNLIKESTSFYSYAETKFYTAHKLFVYVDGLITKVSYFRDQSLYQEDIYKYTFW